MKINFRNIIIFAILIVVLVVGSQWIKSLSNKTSTTNYCEIIDILESDKVTKFTVANDGKITITYKENNKELTKSYVLQYSFQYQEINEIAKKQFDDGKLQSYNYEEPKQTSWFVTYLPYIIFFGLLIIAFIFLMRSSANQGKAFSQAHVKANVPDKNKVLFSDVAGADEEKEELQEVVEFLKNPVKYTQMGAKIPRGCLLVGPPGTGKTLLAKAVAGEAGVPFYSISGSDFVEMYVGVGASRVRSLFETARKNPASIIFIDEIDAVGRHRGAGLGGGHDEREQTLNQLLVEMDGFGDHQGVIVMAATNRPDILDPALLRPGRFDRQITVNVPDLKGREDILRVHAKNKPLGSDVDVHKIAQTTVGFTGADLANLLNESALLATRRNKSLIGMQEIEDATLKIIVGTEKRNKIMSEKERKNTCYHESGHAILSHLLPGLDPVTRISIIPSSKGALGYTLTPPVADKYSEYKKVMENEIAMLLGGRVAEQLIFDDYTGGASQDIKEATKVARKMVTVYGMSDKLGPVNYAGEHSRDEVFLGRDFNSDKNYSEETAAVIDREVHDIIEASYAKAKEVLSQNIDKMDLITKFLLEYEVMDSTIFKAIMDDNATFEQLVALEEEKERQMKERNEQAAKENAKKLEALKKAQEEESNNNESSLFDENQ